MPGPSTSSSVISVNSADKYMSDYTDIMEPDDDSYASDEDLKAVIEESLRGLNDTRLETRNFTRFWCLAYGANNVGKKIAEASRKAANLPLSAWIGNITNHFWYCSKLAQVTDYISCPPPLTRPETLLLLLTTKSKRIVNSYRGKENQVYSPHKRSYRKFRRYGSVEYKHGSSLNTESSGSDSYRDILTSHKKDMIDEDVEGQILKSEDSVKTLVAEIKMLGQRVVQSHKAVQKEEEPEPPMVSTMEQLPRDLQKDFVPILVVTCGTLHQSKETSRWKFPPKGLEIGLKLKKNRKVIRSSYQIVLPVSDFQDHKLFEPPILQLLKRYIYIL
ncbi:hypothetical protein BSL78_21863 [Apostichopus japonicus]|uniref:Uncharacterized protein n=1 Tax=Stichopus japonicus TaxID=307972 RepID=A0A2G8JZV2_STIJA|nr:hypothetical protein BSL78_21863 [Apostichopus japonicus]